MMSTPERAPMARKPMRTALFTLVVFASLAVSSLAQTSTAQAANQVTELDVNGLKILVKRRPSSPTVAAGIFFKGGARDLTPQNAGIEKVTLATATEATKSYPRQRLRKEMSRLGTVITTGINPDYSALSLISTKGAFETSWKMFVDVAINPVFAPEDVSRIKENALTALRTSKDSPEGLLDDAKDRIVYAGHPYVNSPDGTVESITKLQPADLAAWHKRLLQTSRMLLVIVGDVEPDAIKALATAAFSSVPRGTYKDTAVPALNFAQGSVDVTQKGVETDYVAGVFTAPSLRDPDYYAMRTAVTLLQNAVFNEVRVKRNLSYAPDAELASFAANTGEISVSSKQPTEAVSIMLNEIKKLRQSPVENDEIARIADFFATTYYLKQETSAAQAGELAQYEIIGGGWRNSLSFLDKMRAVRPADVQAAATKYMKNIRFVVVGNPSDVDKNVFLQNLSGE
jgi:zinc protease